MNEQAALALGRETITIAAVLCAPLLAVAVIVGLAITILQTVTSVQEQTLTFVVKMGAVLAVLIALMPWLTATLCQFTVALLGNMGRFAG